jgi:phosphoserine phosphatase RsbU/P
VTQSNSFKLTLLSNQTITPEVFELTNSEIVIGRDENADLTIASQAVSRRHARLIREGDGYVLEDLGSSNGTFINGQKFSGRRSLKSGDQIRLGRAITLVYEAPRLEKSETSMEFASW